MGAHHNSVCSNPECNHTNVYENCADVVPVQPNYNVSDVEVVHMGPEQAANWRAKNQGNANQKNSKSS